MPLSIISPNVIFRVDDTPFLAGAFDLFFFSYLILLLFVTIFWM